VQERTRFFTVLRVTFDDALSGTPTTFAVQRPCGGCLVSTYMPMCSITRYQAWSLFS